MSRFSRGAAAPRTPQKKHRKSYSISILYGIFRKNTYYNYFAGGGSGGAAAPLLK